MADNVQQRLGQPDGNQQAFREHNRRRARIEQQAGTPRDEAVPFVCECADPSCARPVEVPLGEYERALRTSDRFVVLPGHEDPAAEVVERHEGYLVVSKPPP